LCIESRKTIEWSEWKVIEFNLNEIEDHSGRSNDGFVDYPLQYEKQLILENQRLNIMNSHLYNLTYTFIINNRFEYKFLKAIIIIIF